MKIQILTVLIFLLLLLNKLFFSAKDAKTEWMGELGAI